MDKKVKQEYFSIHCMVISSELKKNNIINYKIIESLKRLDILLSEEKEKTRKLENKTIQEKAREVLNYLEDIEYSD